jgi:hypothetical protein
VGAGLRQPPWGSGQKKEPLHWPLVSISPLRKRQTATGWPQQHCQPVATSRGDPKQQFVDADGCSRGRSPWKREVRADLSTIKFGIFLRAFFGDPARGRSLHRRFCRRGSSLGTTPFRTSPVQVLSETALGLADTGSFEIALCRHMLFRNGTVGASLTQALSKTALGLRQTGSFEAALADTGSFETDLSGLRRQQALSKPRCRASPIQALSKRRSAFTDTGSFETVGLRR